MMHDPHLLSNQLACHGILYCSILFLCSISISLFVSSASNAGFRCPQYSTFCIEVYNCFCNYHSIPCQLHNKYVRTLSSMKHFHDGPVSICEQGICLVFPPEHGQEKIQTQFLELQVITHSYHFVTTFSLEGLEGHSIEYCVKKVKCEIVKSARGAAGRSHLVGGSTPPSK